MACALALVSLRSMALAVAYTVDTRPPRTDRPAPVMRRHPSSAVLTRREVFVLGVEIAITIGIALATVGLAAAAALPGHLLIGALLAQLAVLGALVAPPVVVRLGGLGIRPAAFGLGVAQLAQLAFFVRAIQALL
jgi:hypothetical protein